jgi:predicted NBD/HSP70 family sugar kinase
VLSRASTPVGGSAHDEDVIGPGPGLLDEALGEAPVARGQLRLIVVGVPAPVMDGAGLPLSLRAVGPSGPGADGRSYLQWPSADLAGEMARRVGVTTVVENDANLGALAEATFGAGRGTGSFLYLRLARGVGAGLMAGGRLHRGATGFAGELGHVQVRDDGPLCACGGRGCLHGILGDALVRAVQPAYDRALTFRDVLELAAGGETGPRRARGPGPHSRAAARRLRHPVQPWSDHRRRQLRTGKPSTDMPRRLRLGRFRYFQEPSGTTPN